MLHLQLNQTSRLRTRLVRAADVSIVIALAAIFYTATNTSNISGVINDYQVVTYVEGKNIAVEDASAFSPGDKLIIMQMKGALISTADDSTYGDITSFGEAGNYELGEVRTISGDTLQLTLSLCQTYDPANLVQVIRVPVYEEVEVNGHLSALAWNGEKGGIVALEATEKIILGADIDVSEMGFRGGDRNGNANSGGLTYICDFNSGQGGIKGEGIVELPWAACRGKLANGGGGANDHNGGGGGGSGYGAGGQGGHGWKSHNTSDLDKGGRGGLSLQPYYDAGLPKLFLGGGGGGGHQNNGASFPAGNGGGVVILVSPVIEIIGNHEIRAQGAAAQDHNIKDGASGGGGGGSIFLDTDQISNPQGLTLNVSGGDGATITTGQQHGPGGGGGGGLINTTSALPSQVTTVLAGGTAGMFISTSGDSNPHHNTSHGASNGRSGAILTNLYLPICSAPPSLDLNGTQPGTDYEQNYLLGDQAIRITDSSLNEIQDLDDLQMQQMIITLTNPVDSIYEALSIGLDSVALAEFGLRAYLSDDRHQIIFSGAGLLADYIQALSSVRYQNNSPDLNLESRVIQVTVDDGGAVSNVAVSNVHLGAGVLPVEWLSFEVEAVGARSTLLTWQTAQEENNRHFQVERALVGGSFSPIGRVAGSGTTRTKSTYTFRDTGLPADTSLRLLYRIRQVDFNGVHTLSKQIEFRLSGVDESRNDLSVRAFPNPAKGRVQIEIQDPSSSLHTLTLLDLNGQVIRQTQSGSQT
ncbi:MAG: hypothetical protein AAF804_10315, partial [Bacteroidota bacterium]